MEKLTILEKKYDLIYLMIDLKVEKKSFQALEDKMSELRNSMAALDDKFALKTENKDEHDRMSANLRNLYELLVNHNHKQGAMDQGPDINEIFHCSGCE